MSNLKELERKVDLLVSIVTSSDNVEREHLLIDLNNMKNEIPDNYKSLRHTVEDFLTDFGIPSSILGYGYLTTAVSLIVEKPEFSLSVTKKLYPEVARLHNSTSSRVERAIRHAIESAFDKVDDSILYKIFGNSVSIHRGKPTNTEFIFRAVQLIQRDMEV